ncbi:MAG: hypothetical protein ACI95C_000345 [Pseudohongiellaceae bacterium]|jgi:hypothetical protein
MNKTLAKFVSLASVLAITIALTLSVKAAEIASELSTVTLFVEGMMKSRGGVT